MVLVRANIMEENCADKTCQVCAYLTIPQEGRDIEIVLADGGHRDADFASPG